jgi:hypothetical protein
MGSKELGFDVVVRGDTRDYIKPGSYVFFQREKEHGGGFWLGQAYDDWFGFVSRKGEEALRLKACHHER